MTVPYTPQEIIEKAKKEIWHPVEDDSPVNFDNRILELLPSLESILKLNGSYIHISNTTKMEFAYIDESIVPVLGYSVEEWKSKGVLFSMEIYCHDDVIATKVIHDHILEYSKRLSKEERQYIRYTDTFRMRHKNGHYVWLLNHLIFLSSRDNGLPHMLLSYATDISHAKNNDDIIYLVSKYNPAEQYYDILEAQIYKNNGIELLSPKEKEVLRCLANGLNNEEIASQLNMSVHTVSDHRKNMLCKTDMDNTCHLLAMALNHSIF